MTLEIEYDELMTILNNCRTAIDALIPVSEAAMTGNVTATIMSVPRAMELIQQSTKSTYSVVNQVRTRYESAAA